MWHVGSTMRVWCALFLLATVARAGEVFLVVQRDGKLLPHTRLLIAGLAIDSGNTGRVRVTLPRGEHEVIARFPKAPPGRFGGDQNCGKITVVGDHLGLAVNVPAPKSLSGYVTAVATGRALPGATVTLHHQGKRIAEAKTDEFGRFVFGGLAPGAVQLKVNHGDFPEVQRFQGVGLSWPVEIEMGKPGGPRAPVRRALAMRGGLPAKGVSAEITLADGAVVVWHDLSGGYLRLPPLRGEGLTKGRAVKRIVMRDRDGWSAEVPLDQPGAVGSWDWVELRGATLAGTVVGPDGPVPGAVVTVSSAGTRRSTITGDDGAYEIADLNRIAHVVDVLHPTLRPSALAVVDLSQDRTDHELTVIPARTIRGRVTGLEGDDFARVLCGDRTTRTKPDGSFVLTAVRQAKFLIVTVLADGYVGSTARFAGEPVELTVDRAVQAKGRVRDRDGRPLGGAFVLPVGRRASGQVRTAGDGTYTLPPLANGTKLRVRVWAAGHAAFLSGEVVLAPGLELPAVTLEPGVALSGFVRDEKGQPVAGVMVRADVPAMARASQATGTDGAFRIVDLPPGRVQLRLMQMGVNQQALESVKDIFVTAPASDVVFVVRQKRLANLAAGEGIAWTGDVPATLDRARRENRPILVAINALDGEGGNLAMATQRYRDPVLVEATSPFLCLVASPSVHDDGKSRTTCTRFGSCTCKDHQEVLNWAMLKWADNANLTSPQHLILGPDGSLLWRRPFWVDVAVLKRALERALVQTAPRRALELAETREIEDPVAFAKSGDPLAAAVLLNLYEETSDGKYIEALKSAPREAWPLIRLYLVDDPALLPVADAMGRGKWWRAFHEGGKGAVPPPQDAMLCAAWERLKAGDKQALDVLLNALRHPVRGPEVRACLATLAGDDLGSDPDRWREVLGP